MTDKPARSRRKPAATPGERLRTAILTGYVLDPGEPLLPDQAVSVADALARLNREVAAERTLITKGSRGQAVALAAPGRPAPACRDPGPTPGEFGAT